MKRYSIIGFALLYLLAAQAIEYPTTSYEISNGWLVKWTGPETDIDFTADPNLYGLNGIWDSAFEGNENIRSVKFERGLGDVNMYAFKDCPNLETVVFDNTGGMWIDYTWIDISAFYNCPKLRSVTFSEYVKRVNGESFEDCPSLTNFSVDNNHPEWKSVNGIIYTKNQEKLLLFPQGITGHHDLNNKVVEIGNYAFFQSHLSTIYLTNNLQCIGEDAFDEAKQLTTVAFPNSLREIKRHAFYRCEALKSLMLPASLETIGDGAFTRCLSLPETIKIPASVTNIDGPMCPRCPTVKRFEVNSGNSSFSTRDGILYNYWGDKLIEWPFGSIGDVVTIPEGTTIIGWGIFLYAPLKEVNFPTSLREVEENAFRYSSLEKVSLPEGTTKLYYGAFSLCDSLRTIELPSTLTEMEESVFRRWEIYHNRRFTCHMPMPVGESNSIEQSTSFLAADTLYVPEESIDFYSIAPGWRDFGTILPIPVLQNYIVTVTQTYGNGLIIVYLGNDEIDSGTEVQEGSTITIKVLQFNNYELSALLVNGEEVETVEEGTGIRSCTVAVTGPMNISAIYVYNDPAGISQAPWEKGNAAVYDLQGRPATGKQKGIFIVKDNDGAIKKKLVK